MASPSAPFQLLLAPTGQFSGDGQLRELMRERRSRASQIWYLPPALLEQLGLASAGPEGPSLEGLVTDDPSVQVWLQLRFGGRSASTAELNTLTGQLQRSWLEQQAGALPPAPPQPPVAQEASALA